MSDKLDEWIEWSVEKSLSTNDKGEIVGSRNKEGVAQLIMTIGESERFETERQTLVSLIVDGQQDDGSWKPDGQLPSQKRAKTETTVVSTMWNALAVASQKDSSDCYATAVKHVATSDTGKSTEWFVAKLLLAQQARQKDEVSQLAEQIRSQQNEDGGWGWLVGDASDALGTGMAMYALAQSGAKWQDHAIRSAAEFLVTTQQTDGSWQVRGTKANKQKRIEETASYWGTTWAVLGMLQVLPDAE